MGWLDKFFKGIDPSGVASSAVDFGFQALANSVLPMSRAQRQQNDFSSQEARIARDFSAQQAELSRDWQEQMYERYDSLQGRIAQANEAGVNPLFALGASANMSASSSPVPTSTASPGTVSPVGQISDMTSAALGFGKLKAEIDNIKSSTRQMNARALIDEIDSATRDQLNGLSIQKSVKAIETADVDIELKTAQIGEIASRIALNTSKVEETEANIAYLTSEVLLNTKKGVLMDAQILEIASQIGLNQAQATYFLESVKLVKEEVEGLKLDNVVKDKTVFSRVDLLSSQAAIADFDAQLKEYGFDVEKWLIDATPVLTEANMNNTLAQTGASKSNVLGNIAMLLIASRLVGQPGGLFQGKPAPIGFPTGK